MLDCPPMHALRILKADFIRLRVLALARVRAVFGRRADEPARASPGGAKVHRGRWLAGLTFIAACALLLGATPLAPVTAARAATLPTGFQETIVFTGLTEPTVLQFAGDGRVFVGEKSGLVKVFDNLSDTTPTVFADLRTKVHNFWDRGLLGMALDPSFPSNPYVSGGDGASFNFTDWGQDGSPLNPCGDPPGGVGAALTPPTAEGGALRSQDLRSPGDPTGLSGTVL